MLPLPDSYPLAEAPQAPSNGEHAPQSAWIIYNREARWHDAELEREWISNIDGLLVVAALFCAVLGAFYLESMKLLTEDPLDIHTQLLLSMSSHLSNISYTMPEPFEPKPYAIRINIIFAASFVASFTTVLFAMLARQWVREYNRGLAGIPDQKTRALRRHYRFSNMKRWQMPELIASLPFLIHISLFLFFGGVTDWMLHVHRLVGIVLATGFLVGVMLYAIMTIIPACLVGCPYKSPQSRAIYWMLIAGSDILHGIFKALHLIYLDLSGVMIHAQPSSDESADLANKVFLVKLYDARERDAIETTGSYAWKSLEWLLRFTNFGPNSDMVLKTILLECFEVINGRSLNPGPKSHLDKYLNTIEALRLRIAAGLSGEECLVMAQALFALIPPRSQHSQPNQSSSFSLPSTIDNFIHSLADHKMTNADKNMWHLVLRSRTASTALESETISKQLLKIIMHTPHESYSPVLYESIVKVLTEAKSKSLKRLFYSITGDGWVNNLQYHSNSMLWLCAQAKLIMSFALDKQTSSDELQSLVESMFDGVVDSSGMDSQQEQTLSHWTFGLIHFASLTPLRSELLELLACVRSIIINVSIHSINPHLSWSWGPRFLQNILKRLSDLTNHDMSRVDNAVQLCLFQNILLVWIGTRRCVASTTKTPFPLNPVLELQETEWLSQEHTFRLFFNEARHALNNPDICVLTLSIMESKLMTASAELQKFILDSRGGVLRDLDNPAITAKLCASLRMHWPYIPSFSKTDSWWQNPRFVNGLEAFWESLLETRKYDNLCTCKLIEQALCSASLEARTGAVKFLDNVLSSTERDNALRDKALSFGVYHALVNALDDNGTSPNWEPVLLRNYRRKFLVWGQMYAQRSIVPNIEQIYGTVLWEMDVLNVTSGLVRDLCWRSALCCDIVDTLIRREKKGFASSATIQRKKQGTKRTIRIENSTTRIEDITEAAWFDDFLQIPELSFQWLEMLASHPVSRSLKEVAEKCFMYWERKEFGRFESWQDNTPICEWRKEGFANQPTELTWKVQMWDDNPIVWWEKRLAVQEFKQSIQAQLCNEPLSPIIDYDSSGSESEIIWTVSNKKKRKQNPVREDDMRRGSSNHGIETT